MESELIALVWAISETVELDENSIIEIATLLHVDEDEVYELISACKELNQEREATDDLLLENATRGINYTDDEEEDFYILV